jgi:hypothetical protein
MVNFVGRPDESFSRTSTDFIAVDHVGYASISKRTARTSSIEASMVVELEDISAIGGGYLFPLPMSNR